MKITILLPYKENFSPEYAGAVSLMVKDTCLNSKYKKNIKVVGYTKYRKKFNIDYHNIDLNKKFLFSTTKEYLKKFIFWEKTNKSDIIEIHNRPEYLNYIFGKVNSRFVLYFHNDPLTIKGSKTSQERIKLLNKCSYIVVISKWIKNQFIKGLENDCEGLMYKFLVIPHSVDKPKIKPKINAKKKCIVFVGRLNHQKGYDLFGKAIIKILNEFKDWEAVVAGDEPRQKIFFTHKKLKLLGFIKHNKILDLFEKSSIAVVPSRWEEPLGRTGFESSSRACAPIISNRGGLPETITNGIILKKLNVNEIYKSIKYLIKNKNVRKQIQNLSFKNFKNSNKKIVKKIDNYRNNFKKKININFNKNLKILHITNFNERHNGRLFYNTGQRINNGFIRLNHSVLNISDRDIVSYYRSLKDLNGSKTLNKKLIEVIVNFVPDIIVLGHADLIKKETLKFIKEEYPSIKIAQWFLDRMDGEWKNNRKRFLDKIDYVDCSFCTSAPDYLKFKKKYKIYYIPNPADESFENLKVYNDKSLKNDVFFAMSHGVHRGNLKKGKFDQRETIINKLLKKTPKIKYDLYGLKNIQPVWANKFKKSISNSKMGLNLSQGKSTKYYSSDRITQLIGNGLLTFIDKKTKLNKFFSNNEVVFYNSINDLSKKIIKFSQNDKLRIKIAKNGRDKYLKYFNSKIVADFIINKTLQIKSKKSYFWDH